MKLIILYAFIHVVCAVGLVGECVIKSNNCDKGLVCKTITALGRSGDYCVGTEDTKCSAGFQCASGKCVNGACVEKCTLDKDCVGDKYCNKSNKCVPKGENGAKCESYTQCSQSNAQRSCTNGVCGYHGAKPGQACSGNNCTPGYYCDLSSNKYEKITGGCKADSNCIYPLSCCFRTGICIDRKIDC
jgi:hypothetical protein